MARRDHTNRRPHWQFEDESGARYGKLTVYYRLPPSEHGSRSVRWVCYCDCGRRRVVRADKLRSGRITTCKLCAGGQAPTIKFPLPERPETDAHGYPKTQPEERCLKEILKNDG